MNNITDEMLNRYLDNDLTSGEIQQVKSAMEKSAELKKKFAALVTANNLLKNTEADLTSVDFTKNLMQKLKAKTSTARQQKYFLFSFLILFGVIVFGITGYLFYEIILSAQSNESTMPVSISKKIIPRE